MACCSRWVIFWLRASMSAGAPSPDSRHACSPSASDRRCSSWRTRAFSRMERSWAASRSACRDARVTAGPVARRWRAGLASRAWILLEQVAVPVEEGAVHRGGAGDAGHADLGAVGGGAVERGDDALAAAGGVGLAACASSPRSAGSPPWAGQGLAAGHAVAFACEVRAGWRTTGMPRVTARCLRTTVTASSMLGAVVRVAEPGDVAFDAADELPDAGDLLLGGGGVGAGPLVDAADGGGEPFAGAQQVIEVGGQVGEVGDVGAYLGRSRVRFCSCRWRGRSECWREPHGCFSRVSRIQESVVVMQVTEHGGLSWWRGALGRCCGRPGLGAAG